MISDEMIQEAVLEVEQAICEMLSGTSECDHVFSLPFQRKMNKLIRKTNHPIAYKVLNRAACILISFFISGSLFVAFNTEVRAAVVNWVKEQFEDVYQYFFIGETADEENKKAYHATWLPDGYTMIDSIESENGSYNFYVNDLGDIIHFSYIYGTERNTTHMGSGEYEHKYVTVEGLHAEVYIALEGGNSNGIAWVGENGKVLFYIFANLTENDLIKMAQNITEVK